MPKFSQTRSDKFRVKLQPELQHLHTSSTSSISFISYINLNTTSLGESLVPTCYSRSSLRLGFQESRSTEISPAIMSEAPVRKPDKDFTSEVDKQLPEAEKLAQVRHLSNQI